MDPLTVDQVSQKRSRSTQPWRRAVAWSGALGVVSVAALWFWVISVPGTFLLTLVPFVLFFTVVGVAALVVLITWSSTRRSGDGDAVPVPTLVVVVTLIAVVVGTRADLSVRLRFEQQRDLLTELATSSVLPPAADDARRGLLAEVPGYGSVEVVAVPGGTMVVTGGEGAANGFVYLPDARAVERWQGPTALKSIGGHWYLTV